MNLMHLDTDLSFKKDVLKATFYYSVKTWDTSNPIRIENTKQIHSSPSSMLSIVTCSKADLKISIGRDQLVRKIVKPLKSEKSYDWSSVGVSKQWGKGRSNLPSTSRKFGVQGRSFWKLLISYEFKIFWLGF